jgi:hypothetical protein
MSGEASTSRVIAKVVLVTRDEYDIVDDFFDYHARLVGAENMYIVDNGSTDFRVLEAYDRFRARGATVVIDRRPFREVGTWMTAHMLSLRHTCDFILPLETDEFIYRRDRPDEALDPGWLREYLSGQPADVSVLSYGSVIESIVNPSDRGYRAGAYDRPARRMTTFKNQGWDKIIVRSSAFLEMAQWCHHARFSCGTKVVSDLLGLVHFHDTGFKRKIERSMLVLETFGYVDTSAPLEAQLERAQRVLAMGVACGHKLEYYVQYLKRRMALNAFKRIASRLPRDFAELATVVSSSESPRYMDMSLRSLAAGNHDDSKTRSKNELTFDDLLFADVADNDVLPRDILRVTAIKRVLDSDSDSDSSSSIQHSTSYSKSHSSSHSSSHSTSHSTSVMLIVGLDDSDGHGHAIDACRGLTGTDRIVVIGKEGFDSDALAAELRSKLALSESSVSLRKLTSNVSVADALRSAALVVAPTSAVVVASRSTSEEAKVTAALLSSAFGIEAVNS